MATYNQLRYIKTLAQERSMTPELALRVKDALMTDSIYVDWQEASSLIDQLKNAPLKQEQPAPAETVPAGIYKLGDDIYRVKISKSSWKSYANLLTEDGFVYAPGVVSKLSLSNRLTLEEAKAYGAHTGVCAVCGRTLTNEISVREGIGPICSGRI